ncbi:hypothetical protein BDN71DRAFT_1454304, partial [Pleurotus eryngii]
MNASTYFFVRNATTNGHPPTHALPLHVKRAIFARRAHSEARFLRPPTRRSVRRPADTDNPNI